MNIGALLSVPCYGSVTTASEMLATASTRRPNLSGAARRYLEHLDLGVEDLFHHVLAVLHDPAYREANAGALRMEVAAHPTARLARWRRLRGG